MTTWRLRHRWFDVSRWVLTLCIQEVVLWIAAGYVVFSVLDHVFPGSVSYVVPYRQLLWPLIVGTLLLVVLGTPQEARRVPWVTALTMGITTAFAVAFFSTQGIEGGWWEIPITLLLGGSAGLVAIVGLLSDADDENVRD